MVDFSIILPLLQIKVYCLKYKILWPSLGTWLIIGTACARTVAGAQLHYPGSKVHCTLNTKPSTLNTRPWILIFFRHKMLEHQTLNSYFRPSNDGPPWPLGASTASCRRTGP